MKLKKFLRETMVRIKERILKTRIFYYLYLILKGTNKSQRCHKPILTNAVLKTKQEYKNALNQVKSLGLILHTDLAKNWDILSALSIILKLTNKNASILDGGGVNCTLYYYRGYFYMGSGI